MQMCIADDQAGPNVLRATTPHPCPLPKGEGETHAVSRRYERAQTANRLATILPLPPGEGRGEGQLQHDIHPTSGTSSAMIRPPGSAAQPSTYRLLLAP